MQRFHEWLGVSKSKLLNEVTFNYTLQRPGGAIEVIVHGEYHPASRGYRDRLGVPEEPDEPEDFEIDYVTDESGQEVQLADNEYGQIIQAFLQQRNDRDDDRF